VKGLYVRATQKGYTCIGTIQQQQTIQQNHYRACTYLDKD